MKRYLQFIKKSALKAAIVMGFSMVGLSLYGGIVQLYL